MCFEASNRQRSGRSIQPLVAQGALAHMALILLKIGQYTLLWLNSTIIKKMDGLNCLCFEASEL